MTLGVRWLKFNAVGLIGIGVQLGALALFTKVLGWNYLAATALAVETAVLHNFGWHEVWTWRDRRGDGSSLLPGSCAFTWATGWFQSFLMLC